MAKQAATRQKKRQSTTKSRNSVKPIKKKSAQGRSTKTNKSSLAKRSTTKRKQKVSHIPKGQGCITPYLIVDSASGAIDYYKKVFDAKEAQRISTPQGKIRHAALKIGDAAVMLADECTIEKAKCPKTIGGSPVTILCYVKDVDSVFKKAVNRGAHVLMPVEDTFYGDRCSVIKDPFGHIWYIATRKENVTPVKMRKRLELLSNNLIV